MKKGFYYLFVTALTILCAMGGIKLIHFALPYSSVSEIFILSVISAFLILAFGWVLGVIFEPKPK